MNRALLEAAVGPNMGLVPTTLTLGIDLGGTHARAALVDGTGKIVASARNVLSDRSPLAVIEAIVQASEATLAKLPSATVGACGVGVAGQLQGSTGHVLIAPNLGWREVPFGSLLGEKLKRPVRVVNDLSAAAWGEHRAGAARGDRDVYVVFVGSGVGSAIISNGQLVLGATGVAGELGHTKVVLDGRKCGCGEHGCLEAYVGGHNLMAQMQEALASGQISEMTRLVSGDLRFLTPAVLEKAALSGDKLALDIYERATHLLGLAIANQITVLNPAKLVLGGGVLVHAPKMQERVREAISRYSSLVSREVTVSQAALGDDSGLIGAALLATEAG